MDRAGVQGRPSAAGERGEEVILSRRDNPVVELRALESLIKHKRSSGCGALAGYFSESAIERLTHHPALDKQIEEAFEAGPLHEGECVSICRMKGFFHRQDAKFERRQIAILENGNGFQDPYIEFFPWRTWRFHLPDDWETVLLAHAERYQVSWLPISPRHCRWIQDLPFHHQDPFDRLIRLIETPAAG